MEQKFRHKFKGYGMYTSSCNVYIAEEGDIFYVLFEDINDGTSVTNASEQLASEVISLLKLNKDQCRFFEKYENEPYIDEIIYEWNGNKAKNAFWKRCIDDNVKNIWDI